jgi:hypothetical protein
MEISTEDGAVKVSFLTVEMWDVRGKTYDIPS